MSDGALQVAVTGTVQGVGFRYHAKAEADRLEIRGWVRNEYDGTVTIHAEGGQSALDDFVAWCQQGPQWAEVQSVATTAAALEGHRTFQVRL